MGRRTNALAACPLCAYPEHDFTTLPQVVYAYLLGLYLGDGTISQHQRTWRISLDMNWPGIMLDCANAMEAVLPENRVSFCRPDPNSWCAVAQVYSKQLVCLFPQHGAGMKHQRKIELRTGSSRSWTSSPSDSSAV